MSSATILLAEDDPVMQELVSTLLERAGHTVAVAGDGQEALRAVYERRPQLVVLDVGMPKLDGWQVLERIREVSEVPVLLLTAESDEGDKVRGLRGGADDFVTKPFGRQELIARVEVLLRRSGERMPQEAEITRVGEIEVDHEQRLVTLDGRELALTPLEFRLLAAFVRNPRQVLSGDRIIDMVWGEPFTSTDQVKLLVGRLRRKLGEAIDPQPIETVRGFGYRFVPPDA